MSEQPPFGPEAVPHVRSRSNLAVVLVIVGLVILLSRIHVLGAIVWSALLPIGMVAFGLELLTESRYRRQIVSGALLAALVIAPLIGVGRMFDRAPDAPQSDRAGRTNSLGSLEGVDQVEAHVALTAGRLRIEPLGERSDAVVALDNAGARAEAVTRQGTKAVVQIDQPLRNGDLDLQLTRRVPLDLSVVMGTGEIDRLDLEEIQLRNLEVHQTVGDAQIALPREGTMNIEVSSDVGDVEIDVPDDLAVRIEASTTIGDIDIDDRFEQRDGAYVSEGYSDSAANRATIHITTRAGDITVR